MNLAADIALAQRLADAAAAAIRPHFRSGLASERKGDATPVTLADRAGQAIELVPVLLRRRALPVVSQGRESVARVEHAP